jgi:RNA polymerase sigma factor (sigma-70 family)
MKVVLGCAELIWPTGPEEPHQNFHLPLLLHFPSNKHRAGPLLLMKGMVAQHQTAKVVDDIDSNQADWVRAALRQYEGPLLRYAARITGDLERARDIVQDTFVRLCAEDPSRLNGRLAEWLFTVCRNRALDVQRKERRMTPLHEIELESRTNSELSPASALEQQEDASQVLRLLDSLPKNQQEVVRLKFQNDLSYQEISRITKLSVSNVGFLIHTAVKTIRRKLQAESNLRTS